MLSVLVLFYIFTAVALLIDYFSHIIIEEKYMDAWWQYALIAFFSLFFIYGAYILHKRNKTRQKIFISIIGVIFMILVIYIIFNREVIVLMHLISDKKPYILKTQITEVVYEHVMRRRAWKEIRIKNYNKLFNTVRIFKGNRYLKLYQGDAIQIYGLKSKFGFTYLDFEYNEDNKTLERNSLP